MTRWRLVVALVAVLVWGLLTPVATASNPCTAMAMCGGSCGATPSVVSQHVDVSAVTQASEDVTPSTEHAVATALKVAEPPPRLPSFSA